MSRADLIRSVLFVGAHPDDETIIAGGTLAMLHERGIYTHVICATDGRGGETGDVPEATSLDALAHIREAELQCAVDALGVDSLTFLGYEDPVVGPNDQLFGFAADETTLVNQIADLIRLKDVDVVMSHGSDGEYGHPAHVQIHRAVYRAIRERTPDVLFYSVAANVPGVDDHLWNASDPAHLALKIQPWVEAKLAAMMCHRTQHLLFKRRRQLTEVRDAIRLTESFRRHWPALPDSRVPDDSFATLLLEAGAWWPEQPI